MVKASYTNKKFSNNFDRPQLAVKSARLLGSDYFSAIIDLNM